MPQNDELTAGEAQRLKISQYERVSSLMLTLLISIGVMVFVLLMVWLTNRILVPQIAVPVEMVQLGGGEGGNGRPMGGTQLETPSDEPFVATDATTPDAQESLSLLAETVAAKTAQLDDPALAAPAHRGSYGAGGGMGGGFGDGRGLGFGPGVGGIGRQWEVIFPKGNTIEAYARQLDFFGIELGVLEPDGKVTYASNLSKPKPDSRTDSAEKEKRYYLTWRSGDLQQADQELLTRAGIDVGNRLILKFLLPATEAQLAGLEKARAGSEVKNVRKTRFGVQAAGEKYSFIVLEQTYR